MDQQTTRNKELFSPLRTSTWSHAQSWSPVIDLFLPIKSFTQASNPALFRGFLLPSLSLKTLQLPSFKIASLGLFFRWFLTI